MPLLYYVRDASLQAGCDVICLQYFFQCSQVKYNHVDDFLQVCDDCYRAIHHFVHDANTYENIVFLSKSLGTLFAGEAAALFGEKNIRHFFLTPLPETIPYIEKLESIVIAGSKDSYFSKENIESIRGLPLPTVKIIDEADHSLENAQDYAHSVTILSNILDLWVCFWMDYKHNDTILLRLLQPGARCCHAETLPPMAPPLWAYSRQLSGKEITPTLRRLRPNRCISPSFWFWR